MTDQLALRRLEGRTVSVALADGSRLDSVLLVSAGRGDAATVWVYGGGTDHFVPRNDVIDAWESPPGPRRRHRYQPLSVALATVLTACSGSPGDSEAVGTLPEGGDPVVVVIDERAEFDPPTLELPQGESVAVEIRNEDDTDHDFAIADLDIQSDRLEPGAVATVELEVPDESVPWSCTLHFGMRGTIDPI
jgi:hypothetical protein